MSPTTAACKLVAATEAGETARVEAIAGQARANGVEGLVMLSGAQARRMEPELNRRRRAALA